MSHNSSGSSSVPASSDSARMRMPPGIEWLFFDLDGTLWDHEQASRRALLIVCERYGFDPDEFLPRFHKANQEAWDLLAGGHITRPHMRERRFRQTLAALESPPASEINLDELNRCYFQNYLTQPESYWIDGGPEVVEAARRGPWRIAVLTNGSRDTQAPKVQSTGLDGLLSLYWGPEEAGCLKPAAGFFRGALERAQCAPGRALMIGDSLGDDIYPSLRLGLPVWWFNHNGVKAVPEGLDVPMFTRLADLAVALEASSISRAGGDC